MNVKKATEINRTDKFKICLYARPGIGKTTALKHLTGKTLVFDLDHSSKVLAGEENIDIVEFNRENPVESMNEFLKWFPTVIKDYDNLVIDNVSSWEKDWFIAMGKTSKNGISNEIQHYSMWGNYFLRVITSIYKMPINIVITAWEDSQDLNLESGQILSQYVPQIRGQVLNTFMGLTDVVGRVQVNPKTEARGVILTGNDGIFAKNRLDSRPACKIEELFNFGDTSE